MLVSFRWAQTFASSSCSEAYKRPSSQNSMDSACTSYKQSLCSFKEWYYNTYSYIEDQCKYTTSHSLSTVSHPICMGTQRNLRQLETHHVKPSQWYIYIAIVMHVLRKALVSTYCCGWSRSSEPTNQTIAYIHKHSESSHLCSTLVSPTQFHITYRRCSSWFPAPLTQRIISLGIQAFL